MNGSPFKLGTFATSGGGAFAAIVLGDDAVPLAAAAIARKSALASVTTIQSLLDDWDANFAALQELVAFAGKGRPAAARKSSPACARCRRWRGPARCSTPRRIFRNTSTRCCAPA